MKNSCKIIAGQISTKLTRANVRKVIYDVKFAFGTSHNSKQNEICFAQHFYMQLKPRKATPLAEELRLINNVRGKRLCVSVTSGLS